MAALLAALVWPLTFATAAPGAAGLRTQRVGDVTYFQATLDSPAGLRFPDIGTGKADLPVEAQRRRLARLPRLVPQDRATAHVYFSTALPGEPGKPLPLLEFTGKVAGAGPARLLLLYPVAGSPVPDGDKKDPLSTVVTPPAWAEVAITLDFGKATKLGPPGEKRNRLRGPDDDDLEGRWAAAQARHLAVAEVQAPEFGFFGFAREATGRKYEVPARTLLSGGQPAGGEELFRLYELTTGATALAESLAVRRLLDARGQDRGPRTVAIDKVKGIDVAEHPWEKMLAGKKAEPETLAGLVPHDNYYVTFRGLAPLLACGEAWDGWGGNLLSAYQLSSRDYRLRQRYEKQLCLNTAALGKAVKPEVVRAVALTGSDVYLGEGSDVSVLFHVTDARAFLNAVEPFLGEARKEFGDRLHQEKTDYQGVAIESFVSPLREVSLHRAVVGDVVIHSNSPVALRRILDTRAGRRKSLAGALDFRYMRTVFAPNDPSEDGFLFLSDAFIRQLVGPASKIKQKRRLEALGSLTLVSHAARFVAWETGKLPADQQALLAGAGLTAEQVQDPEGKAVTWDGRRQLAASGVYNTRDFTTPLIELPIDAVTPQEEKDYARFRDEYTRQWRRYFDPVGMRLSLTDRQVRVETYILPLIQSSAYHELRAWVGDGATTFDRTTIPRQTFLQLLTHIAPTQPAIPRQDRPALGDQAFLRFDDGPGYRRLVEWWIRQEVEPRDSEAFWQDAAGLLFQLPATLGVRVGDPDTFADLLKSIKAGPDVEETEAGGLTRVRIGREPFRATLYHSPVGRHWYAGFSADAVHRHASPYGMSGWVKPRTVRELRLEQTAARHARAVPALVFSPDGTILASGSEDRTVKLWDLGAGKEIGTLEHTAGVDAVAFAPDGKTLASGGKDETVTLWDVDRTGKTAGRFGKEVATLRGHTRPVSALAFTPDGKVLASASWDHTVKLWDPATGRERATLEGHADAVRCLAVTADGKTLVSGGDDGTVRVWDLGLDEKDSSKIGKAVRTLRGHRAWVHRVAVTADGKTLASASWDGTVRLWDLADGKELWTLREGTTRAGAVALSADGGTLVAGELVDGTIRVWQPASGLQRAFEARHGDGVLALAITADGTRLASAGARGAVYVWRIPGQGDPLGNGKSAGQTAAAQRGDAKPAGTQAVPSGLARAPGQLGPTASRPAPQPVPVPVNCSVYLAPEALSEASGAVQAYLEWETHRRAVGNTVPWDLLYRTGALAEDATPAEREAAALRHLGFVPVSPDGAPYRYEQRTGEVVNVRHGSFRQPRLHAGLDEKSPLRRLLEQVRTVRADLLFREDGVQTTVTIERKPAGTAERKGDR
jgi:WD40 repeat protein